MAREVLSNGVINPDKYQADWYADLSNNWNLLNNLIGSAISSSEVDSKIATAIQELMIRTFQIVTELPVTGTEGVMYLVLIPDTSKYTAHVWENNAYRELGVIQMTITIDDELSTTSENPAQNKVITNALNNKAPISHTHSASDITSGLATVATSGSYNDLSNKPTIPSKTSDLTNDSGFITSDNTKIPLAGSNAISGDLIPATDNSIDVGSSTKNLKMLYTKGITIDGAQFSPSDYIPRSGGAVITGNILARNVDNGHLSLCSSTSELVGPTISLYGSDGGMQLLPAYRGNYKEMKLTYNGTLTWDGQPIQTSSDQRLKQQIDQIDDKLLDAWEDVNLVQFKYNDAVDQKGKDKARLHTGYVVQQIDEACKSHNVDISEYGLYCHEVYQEETREVEHEDGTKTTEVVRPANEHYSLRYTEALIVECAYLRKCIKELRNEIEELKSSK